MSGSKDKGGSRKEFAMPNKYGKGLEAESLRKSGGAENLKSASKYGTVSTQAGIKLK